jgi:hypothetical protein
MLISPSVLSKLSKLRTAPLARSKTLKVRFAPLIGGVAKPRGLMTIYP